MARKRTLGKKRKSLKSRNKKRQRTLRKMRRMREGGYVRSYAERIFTQLQRNPPNVQTHSRSEGYKVTKQNINTLNKNGIVEFGNVLILRILKKDNITYFKYIDTETNIYNKSISYEKNIANGNIKDGNHESEGTYECTMVELNNYILNLFTRTGSTFPAIIEKKKPTLLSRWF